MLNFKQLSKTGAEIFLAEGTNIRRRHHILAEGTNIRRRHHILAEGTNIRRRHHINLRATFGHIAVYQGLEKQTSPIIW